MNGKCDHETMMMMRMYVLGISFHLEIVQKKKSEDQCPLGRRFKHAHAKCSYGKHMFAI